MAEFSIKHGDTRPILEVALKNPDGSPHNLTGTTGWKLRILLSNSTKLVRDMVVHDAANGVLRYTWQESDWSEGAIIPSPCPLKPGDREHRMEYEVSGAGGAKLTFPNDGWDTLKVIECAA